MELQSDRDKPMSSLEDESLMMMTSEQLSTTCESSDFSPFNHLPAELQTKIFEQLSPNDLKKARQVCSSWRNTIDENIQFSVILDDKKFEEVPIPPWKIKKLLIRSFQAPLQDNFFRCTETLRKLVVWGPVLPSNFRHILKEAENLEELDIANEALWRAQSLWKVNGNIEKITCNRLGKLKIFARADVINLDENLLGLFQQSMPHLTKLQIIIIGPGYAPQGAVIGEGEGPALTRELNVASSLVQFIATKRNLKTLHITIKPHLHVDATQVEQWISQMNTTSNLEHNLRHLKLQILRLCVAPFYLQLLRTLVSGQSELKDFRVQAKFLEQPLQYSSLEDSIRNSVLNLSSIHLEWLAFQPETVINFQLFMLANNLTRVIMKRWWKTDQNHQNGMAKITNLQMLPPKIQDLEIEGLLCNTAELKALAESTDLVFPTLNYVRLRHVGCERTPGFGIDGSVTKAFFDIPSLHRLILGPLKYRDFRSVDQEYRELERKFVSCDFRSGDVINFEFGPDRCFKHT